MILINCLKNIEKYQKKINKIKILKKINERRKGLYLS